MTDVGGHTAPCGCQIAGRTLIAPCDTHRHDPVFDSFTSFRGDYENPEWKIDAGDAVRKATYLRHSILRDTGREPVGMMLPRSLNPRPYDVEGACMGLPVTWGDRVALIYDAEERT